MERAGRLRNPVLKALTGTAAVLAGWGCSSDEAFPHQECPETVEIGFFIQPEGFLTKADDPDEFKITDLNLVIFDEEGNAEMCLWKEYDTSQEEGQIKVPLAEGRSYTFCACANFGMKVNLRRIEELDQMTYHMSYPDGYKDGMPMSAIIRDYTIGEEASLTLVLERMMAKISLRMDRSRLSENVDIRVLSAKIGNCPRRSKVFASNRLGSMDESFSLGFNRKEHECHQLNISDKEGLSGSLSLYMLENMQGRLSDGQIDDCEKVFSENDPRRDICSYVELELSYLSDKMYSLGQGLIYRFYLGEDASSLDVERNCHYHITVRPEDDGLSDGGWRVDKTNLFPVGDTYIKAQPSSYIRGNIGDRIHIWCDIFPPNARLDVGEEFMKEDKARGIYDYEIDENGMGATLTLTGPGTGLIYMEAGMPIYDGALFVIEVNMPQGEDL